MAGLRLGKVRCEVRKMTNVFALLGRGGQECIGIFISHNGDSHGHGEIWNDEVG